MRFATLARTLALLAGLFLATVGPREVARAGGDLTVGGGAVVDADSLNVRGGPGIANPIVGSLTSGTTVRVIAGPVNQSWWRVTDGQQVGYVDGDWLTAAAPPSGQDVYDVDLDLPVHRQMTSVWCDPADLQSWLEYDLGQSLGDSVPVQQSFWNWELAHNAGFTVDQWDASPFAIASAAHQWLPTKGFNHFIYDDPVKAMSTVAWILANPAYREPSVATIWWGDHYVLVRGVRATANPYTNYSDAKILGVYIMDPNQGRPSWLGQDRYIPLSDWVARYLTPVSYLTRHSGVPGDVWQGKYVTVQRDWGTDGPSPGGRVNASPAQYVAAGG